MLRLSIIIPCLQTDERFDETLASILQNRPQHCEVLAVYRGAYDDPYDLQDEVGLLAQPADATLVDLVNAGLAAASADIVLVVACGLQVDEGWTDSAVALFDNPGVGSVSPFISTSDDAAQPVIVGLSLNRTGRRRLCTGRTKSTADLSRLKEASILGPTISAGFYRKSALDQVGGLASAVGDELADVDLALSLRTAGFETILDSESRFSGQAAEAPRVSAFRSGQFAERLYWRQKKSGSLASALLMHPCTIAVELIRGFATLRGWGTFFGRLSVSREIPSLLRDRDRLIESALPSEHSVESAQRRVDAPHGNPQWSSRSAGKPTT